MIESSVFTSFASYCFEAYCVFEERKMKHFFFFNFSRFFNDITILGEKLFVS